MLDKKSTKPIYMQVADWIESEILSGHFKPDERVYSQYQLAEMYTINPATAAKGLNLLADEDILYKKRGLGMFVSEGAKEAIRKKRKTGTLGRLAREVVLEARRLKVSEEQLLTMIRDIYKEECER
ncbi:GntR family transcriptional regulator [Ammoniphilus oxalaticus]|uniref:GntR family transcriptional regulator n=2 Tax=Ammoniphilus oxalaticus TaxID=66863 RepID=A0A419SGQ9_9BACL|nr:GntR family transcriptional regulator [Ammoniphilus oxalaticus]RKD22982.1 GntR family transcriptional regulator [Ammoniphilus oxalaticus]